MVFVFFSFNFCPSIRQMRRLCDAIAMQRSANVYQARELERAVAQWKVLTSSKGEGWYPPMFATEPPALRITVPGFALVVMVRLLAVLMPLMVLVQGPWSLLRHSCCQD